MVRRPGIYQTGDRARDRHCGEKTEVCMTEDKTVVVVVASYRSVQEIQFVSRPWSAMARGM